MTIGGILRQGQQVAYVYYNDLGQLIMGRCIDPGLVKIGEMFKDIEMIIISCQSEATHFVNLSSISMEKIFICPRHTYNSKEGKEIISRFKEMHLCDDIHDDCLEILSVIWNQIELKMGHISTESLKIIWEPEEMYLDMDTSALCNLDLFGSFTSLENLLDHTKTRMGKRYLRHSIMFPLRDVDKIQSRLNSIEELLNINLISKDSNDILSDMIPILRDIKDIDSIIKNIVEIKSTEKSLSSILDLKRILINLREISINIGKFSSSLLQEIYIKLTENQLENIRENIDKVIDSDAISTRGSNLMRHQRCYAVKPNLNGLLDVARQSYREAVDDAYEIYKIVREELPGLKLQHSDISGYYFQINLKPTSMKMEFINIVKKGKLWRFSTMDLIKTNKKIQDSLEEVYNMSDKIIMELIKFIQNHLKLLYEVAESIGKLDFLISLSITAFQRGYIKPEFGEFGILAIKKGRHPIKETIQDYTPNDIFISKKFPFQIISGANMSGKSTFIKQIALISIMAQMGSFVPADYACLPIFDKILCRLANDNIVKLDNSSFSQELYEMNDILQKATIHSLILIDELGRATSIMDGIGIAYAISEEIISLHSITLFVTHFEYLLYALENKVSTHSMHFEVSNGSGFINHRLVEGNGYEKEQKYYGIECALKAGMSLDVINRAKYLADHFGSIITPFEVTKIEKIKRVYEKLLQLGEMSEENTDDESFLALFSSIQNREMH